MAFQLSIKPNIAPMTFRAFCTMAGPFSIALDGFVKGGPAFDADLPAANFNHHEGVDRHATRATCAQVLMYIKNGFLEPFHDKGEFVMNAFVNDCDQDVCLAVFLLKHGYQTQYAMNPLLHRLVDMEDKLDTTAGSYPFPTDLPSLQELAWVFEPYTRFRITGGINRRLEDEFLGVIQDVELRIKQYLVGQGERVALDPRIEIFGGGNGWTMFKEIGAQAFSGAVEQRIHAFVSVRPRDDGRFNYTVARSLPIIRFNVPKILAALDTAEGNPDDHWGGGNTIGGSPRSVGSKLTPNEVQQIVNSVVR